MTSDYARELGEHLDRLAELVPNRRRLSRLSPEDKRYVAGKARAARKAFWDLGYADHDEQPDPAGPEQRFRARVRELHPQVLPGLNGTRYFDQTAPSPQQLAEALISVLSPEGFTQTRCREIMRGYGRERVDAALDMMRSDSRAEEASEVRPDRAGRLRRQVVIRARQGPGTFGSMDVITAEDEAVDRERV